VKAVREAAERVVVLGDGLARLGAAEADALDADAADLLA